MTGSWIRVAAVLAALGGFGPVSAAEPDHAGLVVLPDEAAAA